MTKTVSIAAERRAEKGSQSARKLRESGLIPAILYGHQEESAMLTVKQADLDALLRNGGGHGLLELNVADSKESVVIKEIQWDVISRHPLHVDFARISAGERVAVEVSVVLKGTAPGVLEGGVLDFQMHQLEVECPAENIIEQLPINISELKLGQSILVKDVKLPEGLEILNDPDVVIVQVARKAVEGEAADLLATAAGAEPELIRRPSEKEESAE